MPETIAVEAVCDLRARAALDPIWTFGANTCHAPLWERADMQRHFALLADELRFRHVRCHDVLGDRLGIFGADGSVSFARLDAIYDRLLARGMRPFVELSSLPSHLGSADTSLTRYDFRSSPPRDWRQWYRIVRTLVEHLVRRYGAAEVRRWHFEVWNEPDLAFWSGTQAEYFRLYDLAARAVKEVDPGLRIGGPATSKTAWIGAFLDHVRRPSDDFGLGIPRCDFISTHAYPSDLAFLDADRGDVRLLDANIMRQLFREVRAQVDEAFGAGFPVICGEWNSSAGPLAANHDTCANAAFVAKTMAELSDLCQGSLFWAASDIYEECGFHSEPFHGGYGLLTVNGIRKAAFHAFRLLAEHAGERIAIDLRGAPPALGALATHDGTRARVLLWNRSEPGAAPVAARVRLRGFGDGARPALVERVLPGAGSAYETWLEAGSPPFADAGLLAALEAASEPERSLGDLSTVTIAVPPDTIAQIAVLAG